MENREGNTLDSLRSLSAGRLTLVTPSPEGPIIEKPHGVNSQLIDRSMPVEKLSPSEKLALEALPALPKGWVCAPISEDAKKMGQIISYCNLKEASAMTEPEKARYRENARIHLQSQDRVAKTEDGRYLIISPLSVFNYR
jgi:hypothetical protein